MSLVVVDFETEQIHHRPDYPPKPVGVAILIPGKAPRYMAWGHPTKNNCTKLQAIRVLKDLWASNVDLLFHNARFDTDVAETHLGLPMPPWNRVYDTLYTLFLLDPHAPSLGLKESAERYLGLPPEERDEVRDWLVENRVITRSQNPGPFIAQAPGDVVGRYAIGDVVRTLQLHEKLHPAVVEQGMGPAYDRERRLMPILLENERRGIRVAVDRLEEEIKTYEAALTKADRFLRKRLGDINIDADAEVAQALKAKGIVTEFVKTKTGRDSVSKKNLTLDKFTDQQVALALGYRNRLVTVLSMSMRPWLEQASANGGYITTEWNQVRQSYGDDFKGTRSGRLSCSRIQNITKDFMDKGDGYAHPGFLRVPELPLVRCYLLPDKGDVWVHEDYDQQELKILASFEEGRLAKAYREDPRLDVHTWVQTLMHDLAQMECERRQVKILNFRTVYGGGIGGFAEAIKKDVETARSIVMAWRQAMPDVVALDKDLRRLFREGKSLRTLGGRRYRCEPPKLVGNQMRSFEYKALNYLIQPSAADMTKEAIVRLHDVPRYRELARLLNTVHDELNSSARKKAWKEVAKIKSDVMCSIELEVPVTTTLKVGPSWGELEKV